MPDAPKISVVVPAFNAEGFIGETIESVLAQSFEDWELIVVDDGSEDRTAEIVAAYSAPRIRLIRQDNQGQSAAQNRGFAERRGGFVNFLDADDLLTPVALERLMATLEAHPRACASYGEFVTIDESGQRHGTPLIDRAVNRSRPSGDLLETLLKRNLFANCGLILFRAECVERAGGFRADIRLAQAWEMYCRVAAEGEFVYAGPDPVLEYRIRKGSIARLGGDLAEKQWPAIDAVFSYPKIRSRFGARRLRQLRRIKEGDAYDFVGTEAMRLRDFARARAYLTRAIMRGIFKPRLFILLVCAIAGVLPSFVIRQYEL